jgi:glycosyltransferase involved in cell wall biosynthesis
VRFWNLRRSQKVVLVGIVTRNRAALLRRAIESCLNQSYPRLKVAVLDDGSKDNTWQLRSSYPGVYWTRWERSQGLMRARNHLMSTTDAEFYLSLDDDAWFVNGDEVELAAEYMDANPTLGAVAFDILSPDRPLRRVRSNPVRTHLFVGCGHMLRVSAARECGFYVQSPGLYGSEEKDLCIRLLDREWEIHSLPGVQVWHEKTDIARDIAAQYRSGVCNDLAFAVRRCPFPLVLGVLPLKIINHLRFSLNKDLLSSYWGGIQLFLNHLPRICRARGAVRTRTFLDFMTLTHQIK